MKELLEAGVHFGHQTKRWNPKMKEFIFGERNGIYIIDLQKTHRLLQEALQYVQDLAAQGRTILFVGTKRQAQEAIAEEAQRCGMPYVNERWLGGLLTNFVTVRKSLDRLKELEMVVSATGAQERLTKKELARLEKERLKLEKNLRRHQGHEDRARRRLRDRHPQGGDRGAGGAQAEDPGGRHRGHQLRPGRGGLRRSPATTTRCAPSGCSPGSMADAVLAGRGLRESRAASDAGRREGRRPAEERDRARRRRPAAPRPPAVPRPTARSADRLTEAAAVPHRRSGPVPGRFSCNDVIRGT